MNAAAEQQDRSHRGVSLVHRTSGCRQDSDGDASEVFANASARGLSGLWEVGVIGQGKQCRTCGLTPVSGKDWSLLVQQDELIKRLRTENERLRKALEVYAYSDDWDLGHCARQTLKGGE